MHRGARLSTLLRGGLPLAACAVLAACTPPPPPDQPQGIAPRARPANLQGPVKESPESQAMRAYFAKVQTDLLAQGLLRTDGGGRDTPYNDRMLAENFLRIALYDEYERRDGGFAQREVESHLRRWEVPVRVGLRFGPSVPEERRATDRARISSYLARLSKITGHPIGLSDSGVNFWLHVVAEDERRALGPQVAEALPTLSASEIAGITQMSTTTYCLVYALSDDATSIYNRAFAVIRAEHPDLLRLACLHEEIAQGLGLANDSPNARPSIFNDDEEFALLTTQDELMLKILYDRRLRPGMTVAEARPIVETIAYELLGGES
ncbi:DUF2927 domain-containing protein [Cereibacter azotoformans]|uniref:DUF2927 domain-containing protein n=1 Tax=Cereibacter azotoformans TaxID=43057 RepID=A0A2T5KC83_9RHOB|nr:DUF2927 domain-containing protein [Cereibacter azotoformans]AXQ94115.1 DUF2927 domain-containing protein [Cereibacter sphaeroides]MBO4168081.1 DUF2927 domain-containing protein [Cereibacter azotoformans]PTR20017.1 hypothetical protein C8J28_103143 [Cereibacter azotoformans]UIJ29649.1 DUF2927 domain-containing protein [Cereibacter azotoformans]